MKKYLQRSNGQAISLDWLIGLSLLMVTIISTTVLIVNDQPDSQTSLKEKAEETSQDIKEQTQLTARKSPLYVRGPHNVGKIPVDIKYDFPDGAKSGIMDIPSSINESEDSVVTIVETGNRTHEMTYFLDELDPITYENDIEENGNRIENSYISFEPSNNGLDSLRTDEDWEVLDSRGAEFEDASTTFEEKELHGEVGKLKIYNGSKELILENTQAIFHLRNFTDLYWGEDEQVYNLTGTGDIKEGETPGFTLTTLDGNDYGVTFTGDIEADISKPDDDRVRADINSSRVRIMLHDTDYNMGRERIEFYKNGGIYFGAERQLSGINPSKTSSLENMADIAFENRFNLRDHSYNITVLDMERGSSLPFQDIVTHNREAAVIGRYGNFTETTVKVRLWR